LRPLCAERAHSTARLASGALGRTFTRRWRVAASTVIAALILHAPMAHADGCPSNQPFFKVPEIVSQTFTKDGRQIGVLRGTLRLTDAHDERGGARYAGGDLRVLPADRARISLVSG